MNYNYVKDGLVFLGEDGMSPQAKAHYNEIAAQWKKERAVERAKVMLQQQARIDDLVNTIIKKTGGLKKNSVFDDPRPNVWGERPVWG